MDLSSLNNALNKVQSKIIEYLDNPYKIETADYTKQMDIPYISNQYSKIVEAYSSLLSLITEIQYFISQCKKVNRLIPNNSNLEKLQKDKIRQAIELVKELSEPLYNEKERLKTLEMFYRNLYTQKNF